MTEGNAQHLGEDQLLDYIEGGMESREHTYLRAHLKECRACRKEVEALRNAVQAVTSFYNDELLPDLPPPPRPWKDLSLGPVHAHAHADSGSEQDQRRHTFAGRLRGPASLLAVGTLAAAGLVVSRFYQETPKSVTRSTQVPHLAPQQAVPSQATPVQRYETKAPVVQPYAETSPLAAADPNTEVHIFAALHRLGADMGEPVEVEFIQGVWRVSVVGLSDVRVASFDRELHSLPNVQLVVKGLKDFTLQQALPADAAPETLRSSRLPFQEEFDTFFGSRATLEAFINRALDHSEAILAHAHALQVLDQRFPIAVESMLEPEGRNLLSMTRDDHRAAIRAQLAGIEKDVSLLDGSLSLPDVSSSSNLRILDAAERWDRLLGVILGGSATDQSPGALRSALSGAAADLRRAIQGLQ